MFQRILLASDGSDHALKAARVAAELARQFRAELVVLCVFQESAVPVPMMGSMDVPPIDLEIDRLAEDVQAAVERRTTKTLDEFGVTYQTRREIGHPVDRIVQAAKQEMADLIVMGSRGLGGLESFMLGSVSDRVLHHAHCPVLIVK
jgi:nucleotide-binding universal stress UspA family protein